MQPSARTPEGRENRCAICRKGVNVDPSIPPGDAPCPHCGNLLWFDPTSPETDGKGRDRGTRLARLFELASNLDREGKIDYALDLFAGCVNSMPYNVNCVKSLLNVLHRKLGSPKALGPMAHFMARSERKALKDAESARDWEKVISNGLGVLLADPWNIPVLESLSAACEELSKHDNEPASAGYADCARIYRQCAEEAARSQ